MLKYIKIVLDVNFVDNRYYENVINEMQSFLDENGFKAGEDGSFSNATKSFKVAYNDAKQSYILSSANIDEDGNVSEFSEINAWLFDDSQNAKDAASVGIDFVNSMRKEIGIKIKRAVNTEIELPSASKSGAMTVTGFTKKMLDVFPVLKDDYKEHVTVYGDFLYMNFFGEKLVPLMNDLFVNGSKKQIKKLYDVFEVAYVRGDKDTVNIMVALLCASSYNNEKASDAVKAMLEEDSHFLTSYVNFVPVFAKNKKLVSALIK